MSRFVSRINKQDLFAGLFMLAISLWFLVGAFRYGIGTPVRMGPGFFPMTLGVAGTVYALLLLGQSLRDAGGIDTPAWRPLLFVLASIAAFALVIGRFGMLPGVVVVTVIAALADRSSTLRSVAMVAVGMSVIVYLIFRVGLNVPIPLLKGI